MQILWALGGMIALLAIAVALSTNRRAISVRTVLPALALQIAVAVFGLSWGPGRTILKGLSDGVQALINAANHGINFLFGAALPKSGTVFAFQVLPVVIFIASLVAVLYHLRILQWFVRIIGGALQKILGTSQAESLSATANIFAGMVEAPLFVQPYLKRMTKSEFFTVMTNGLTSVSGSTLVGYALLGAPLRYLIPAIFMSAPAGVLMSKIILPETGHPEDSSAGTMDPVGAKDDEDAEDQNALGGYHNVLDAAAGGASNGLRLALNIGATLIAFISLIALMNIILGSIGGLFGHPGLTFQLLLGYVFSPIMFVIGVPWDEAIKAGSFLGQKIVLNEFVAFSNFAPNIGQYPRKTAAIITFTLTGFANFGSLAILLGGLGQLVPDRRSQIAQYAIRAVLAATLANLMSAAIAGALIG